MQDKYTVNNQELQRLAHLQNKHRKDPKANPNVVPIEEFRIISMGNIYESPQYIAKYQTIKLYILLF